MNPIEEPHARDFVSGLIKTRTRAEAVNQLHALVMRPKIHTMFFTVTPNIPENNIVLKQIKRNISSNIWIETRDDEIIMDPKGFSTMLTQDYGYVYKGPIGDLTTLPEPWELSINGGKNSSTRKKRRTRLRKKKKLSWRWR